MGMNSEFADFIKNSELVQEFKKKQRRDLEIKRAAAIDARTPCEKELEAVSLQITDVKNTYAEALKQLHEQGKTLEREYGDKLLPLVRRSHELEREINNRTNFLLGNYESEIRDGLDFFRQKLSAALSTMPSRTVTIGEKKLSGKTETITYSNCDAVLNCVKYCRAAIVELETMKRDCATCDTGRIETIKSEIPDMREVTEHIVWMESSKAARELLDS